MRCEFWFRTFHCTHYFVLKRTLPLPFFDILNMRSMDFRSGVEAHLKRVLKNLKTEESTLNKKARRSNLPRHWTKRVSPKHVAPRTKSII